jgi:hypothetical protein
MKHTIQEGLRMMGHLLEHHGTTGAEAVTSSNVVVEPYDLEACKWCLKGAAMAVSRALDVDHFGLQDAARDTIGNASLISSWDTELTYSRAEIIERLKNA